MSSDRTEALAFQDDVENALLTLSGHEYMVDPVARVFDAARKYAALTEPETIERLEDYYRQEFPCQCSPVSTPMVTGMRECGGKVGLHQHTGSFTSCW